VAFKTKKFLSEAAEVNALFQWVFLYEVVSGRRAVVQFIVLAGERAGAKSNRSCS